MRILYIFGLGIGLVGCRGIHNIQFWNHMDHEKSISHLRMKHSRIHNKPESSKNEKYPLIFNRYSWNHFHQSDSKSDSDSDRRMHQVNLSKYFTKDPRDSIGGDRIRTPLFTDFSNINIESKPLKKSLWKTTSYLKSEEDPELSMITQPNRSIRMQPLLQPTRSDKNPKRPSKQLNIKKHPSSQIGTQDRSRSMAIEFDTGGNTPIPHSDEEEQFRNSFIGFNIMPSIQSIDEAPLYNLDKRHSQPITPTRQYSNERNISRLFINTPVSTSTSTSFKNENKYSDSSDRYTRGGIEHSGSRHFRKNSRKSSSIITGKHSLFRNSQSPLEGYPRNTFKERSSISLHSYIKERKYDKVKSLMMNNSDRVDFNAYHPSNGTIVHMLVEQLYETAGLLEFLLDKEVDVCTKRNSEGLGGMLSLLMYKQRLDDLLLNYVERIREPEQKASCLLQYKNISQRNLKNIKSIKRKSKKKVRGKR